MSCQKLVNIEIYDIIYYTLLSCQHINLGHILLYTSEFPEHRNLGHDLLYTSAEAT